MKFKLLIILFSSNLLFAQDFKTPYEKGNGNQTTTYEEMVKYYENLDQNFESITVENFGKDDNGEPIKVVVFDDSKNKNTPVILINNGIHPGEPDGIDATMMLMRDLATGKVSAKNLKIAAIQSYNISGMLRRGKYSRANQNGPEEYGFRGNARNYDLNRDFIKNDTENAKTFQLIFQHFKPIFFIDNHVSNGADYQYLFTYISTNKERLGSKLGNYFNEKMQPEILENIEKKGILTTPYVNIHGDSPDEGFPSFMDSPRYATGYTTLFNTLGTVAETHMLKPYPERVRATYEYMVSAINYTRKNTREIQKLMAENLNSVKPGTQYPIQWKLNDKKFQLIDFKGYEAGKKTSEVSGKPRLFYDRNKPFTRKVKFFNEYVPTKEIRVPNYYVIPKSENKVIEYLKRNNIAMKEIAKDSTISVEVYRITDFKTVKNPYEGHYLHYDTTTKSEFKNVNFRKGDLLVSTKQAGVKYLLETLEPEATDSFYNWNFFDAILGQKEYFSDYVFEDTAAELLRNDQVLKTAFEFEKISNPDFAKDGQAQLEWIYRHSEYYEGSVNLYPIYRIL
ncbi:M14 family zinc carboxypeptidase [Kaistella sp. BT6-1-3]|uniref:M14 family zinc carboxypeptidase n=1 Tax=Kaistella yananensis TaxID=2989820 RepID=A0ABT3JLM6_9FLAO|nr:M14 family zinc carboxypeptidase [Kaistella yananensis]MCW4451687.1 M14 family zinc carboxypeptidase [Kaistella yananensis]